MPGDDPLFVFVLLVLAAAAGAWTTRKFTSKKTPGKSNRSSISPDYFKGLNFLLNEQPDKAIEVFIHMAEVDNETVETHFALGNLFRRRGEVDRAIRIHQNIIARPNLAKSQRDQALFALAEDFQKAGLFDRAEKLFLQLSAVQGQRQAAMKNLVSIYEQQKDWAQAIEIRRKLGAYTTADNDGGVAHAYCEMAQQAISKNDLAGARQYLRKARQNGRQLIRGAYMRAIVAEEQNDSKSAVKLCRWIIEQDSSFAVEILPVMMRCLRASGSEELANRTLGAVLKKHPKSNQAFAVAALTHGEYDNPVLMDVLRKFIEDNAFASKMASALASNSEIASKPLSEPNILKICVILGELIRSRSKYECHECGYSGNVLYWQCPGCKDWDSTRPVIKLIGNVPRLST